MSKGATRNKPPEDGAMGRRSRIEMAEVESGPLTRNVRCGLRERSDGVKTLNSLGTNSTTPDA